jgi:hypothetical protein
MRKDDEERNAIPQQQPQAKAAAQPNRQPTTEPAKKPPPEPVKAGPPQPVPYNTPAQHSDGFGDVDDGLDSFIKGHRLKFLNTAAWHNKDLDETVPPDQRFIGIELLRVEQKWLPGVKRPETRVLEAHERFRDVEALNDAAPKEEWREFQGKLVGPYENACIAYLLEPKSMAAYTIVHATHGFRRAVSELKDAVKRKRKLHGDNWFPVVTLSDTFMPTKSGGRQRPHFIIVDWVQIGKGSPPTPALDGPTDEAGDPRPEPLFNDDIPDFGAR